MMKDKSIIFVINTVQTMSGAAKVMLSVAKASLSVFTKVTVVGILNNSPLEDIGEDELEIIPLGANSVNKGLWRISCIKHLRALFIQRKPDVICSFVADACTMARLASLGLNTKVISCERGDPYTTGKLWQLFMRFTYRTSDYSVFQLPSARDFFSSKVKQHSIIIPNPFIPKADAMDRREVKNKSIVSAGRLFDYQKDFSSLIKAFSLIHNEYPDYKLIIYGEGPSRSLYEGLVETMGLKDVVSFPGFVNNVSYEIRDKGIFVLSSIFEGIPNTLLEAMSMGLPCVATNCSPGGAKFLTNDGEYGILLDVGDVNGMARSIKKLIEDPEYAFALGVKAKNAIQRFDTDRIMNQWIDMFMSIIS